MDKTQILAEMAGILKLVLANRARRNWFIGASFLHVVILITTCIRLFTFTNPSEVILWVGMVISSHLLIKNNTISDADFDKLVASSNRYNELLRYLKEIETEENVKKILSRLTHEVSSGKYKFE